MIRLFSIFIDKCVRAFNVCVRMHYYKSRLGFCGKKVDIRRPNAYSNLQNIYMHDNTNIAEGMNFLSDTATFTIKKNSGAAQNLTIITGNHGRHVGVSFKDGIKNRDYDEEKNIIVEEDVWIGANVTITAGVVVGRGSTIGAGTVIRSSIPPYAIVIGNPAKVIGFNFTPEEIIEHEKALYPSEERLSFEILEKNYKKYFLKRIKEIKELTRI